MERAAQIAVTSADGISFFVERGRSLQSDWGQLLPRMSTANTTPLTSTAPTTGASIRTAIYTRPQHLRAFLILFFSFSFFFSFFFCNLRPSRSTQTVPWQQCSLAEQRRPEQLPAPLLLDSVISSSSSLCSIDSRRSIDDAGRKR